ncbi:MAG: MBOAT family protein [Phycisphaerae bacterium]|nr:MBOAT family protein [Phycisphaerae bacterium]
MLLLAQDAVAEVWEALGQYLWTPIRDTPWAFWRGGALRDFWLKQVFDDRYRVCYFLPLLPILLLLRGRALRFGLIATCVIFLGYNFGLLYPLWWLLVCVVFYWITELFAVEAKRKDVLQIGPPLAAIGCVVLVTVVTQIPKILPLAPGLNAWLHANMPWLFPLGTRCFAWEPHWIGINPPPQLGQMMFFNLHLVGVAYFSVRMLHYFSELKRDTIPRERRSLLNFVSYLCYAPTLMQGPIERYPRFQDEMDTCHQRRTLANVPPALLRLGIGLAKTLVSTWYFHEYLWNHGIANTRGGGYYDTPEAISSYVALYLGVYVQIFTLYLDFSGYCDMAAGMSRLLGYRLFENFKRPWLSTSMRDFWRRWHLSLSFILRDYVYIPLGGNRRRVAFNLCVTFFLCGIWHQTTLKVAIWGIVMGLMVYINQRWVDWVKRLDASGEGFCAAIRRNWLKLWPLPQICAWAFTMNAFVWTMLILFGGEGCIRVTWELIRRPLNALLQNAGIGVELPSVNALVNGAPQ